MRQEGHIHDHQGKSYKLPVTDVDKSKRNFPGYKESTPMTLEMLTGDGPGTTDTDLRTHGKQAGPGYTKLYGGKQIKHPGSI